MKITHKWIWFCLSALVLSADQWTKFLAQTHLISFEPYPVLPMFNLTLAYNTGAAFSFLSEAGEWHQWFFMGFSLLMSVFFVVWLLRLPEKATLQLAAISLILGGTLGNLYDRFLYGHVIDFIQVYYHKHYWPVFNLADSAICLGAILLFVDAIKSAKKIEGGKALYFPFRISLRLPS